MPRKSTRRTFLQQSAALSTAFWVSETSAWEDPKSPLERLNFACIGVDGKGSSDTDSAVGQGNVVAVCDIDDNRMGRKVAKQDALKSAKQFNDYRKMLEDMGDEIDAVTVSTPDHSHAPASIMAMRMGKHVFCQKPLTWSLEEARMMREIAASQGVATQMGNQGTAENGLREAVEIVRAGTLGTVKEVHVWTNRPIWPQGLGRPEETPPVPNELRWYLFLGPAKDRPYHPAYHPFKWRGWLDFGTGALGDMACHTSNMAVMALDLFDPLTVEAEFDKEDSPGFVAGETYPKWSVITYQFGERNGRPPVKMVWYDGGKLPPQELVPGEKLPSSGSIIVGEQGTLYSPNDYGAAYKMFPMEKFAEFKKPDPTLPRSEGHFKEFAIACAGGPPAMSNFDYAGRLTETVLLGNVALRAGKKIEWDAEYLKATNAPEVDQYIRRNYRPGFDIHKM
jgi:predicted dehydrogenase